MPIVTPLGAALEAALVIAAYAIAHEMLHYIPARLLGYNAKLALRPGPLTLSPAVFIDEDVEGADRHVILYTPYLLNLLLLLAPNPIARAVGLVTMPNVLLEDEESRRRKGAAAVAAAYAAAALAMVALG